MVLLILLTLLIACISIVGNIQGDVTVPGDFNLSIYYTLEEDCLDTYPVGFSEDEDDPTCSWIETFYEPLEYDGYLFYPANFEHTVTRTILSDKEITKDVSWFFYMNKDEPFTNEDTLWCQSIYGDTLDITIKPDMKSSTPSSDPIRGLSCP